MPFVPVPPGKEVVNKLRPYSTWEWFVNGQLKGKGGQWLGLNSYVTAGGRSSSKGKPITFRGKKWNPCRPYQRHATWIDYSPGVTHLTALNGRDDRVIWKGIASPNAIIVPSDNMPAGRAGSHFSVDTYGIGTIGLNARNRINTELLIKAGRRQVNWGEALGESKSTFRMLAQSASTLARAVLAARRGKFNTVARILRRPRIKFPKGTSVGNKWLAYQYGWKPLMGDIYDSYKHLVKGFDTRLQVLSVSRFLREQTSSKLTVPFFKTSSVRTNARLGAKMFFVPSDNFLSRANQVGMINPFEVAWAVVPFSFVVDWFIPVGNLLEAMSARMSVDFVDGYYGISLSTVGLKSDCTQSESGYRVVSSTASVRRETTSYRRTVMTGLPWPAPHFKSPFSTSHVTSAIALIAQLLKR